MTYISRRLGGDSISAVQELIPVQAIQPHQVAAATHPEKHTKILAQRRTLTRQALERQINEQLSERPAKTR
ncbi:MAG: hypothetical protein ABIS39_06080 [Sphingomicrobium sp.]